MAAQPWPAQAGSAERWVAHSPVPQQLRDPLPSSVQQEQAGAERALAWARNHSRRVLRNRADRRSSVRLHTDRDLLADLPPFGQARDLGSPSDHTERSRERTPDKHPLARHQFDVRARDVPDVPHLAAALDEDVLDVSGSRHADPAKSRLSYLQ